MRLRNCEDVVEDVPCFEGHCAVSQESRQNVFGRQDWAIPITHRVLGLLSAYRRVDQHSALQTHMNSLPDVGSNQAQKSDVRRVGQQLSNSVSCTPRQWHPAGTLTGAVPWHSARRIRTSTTRTASCEACAVTMIPGVADRSYFPRKPAGDRLVSRDM